MEQPNRVPPSRAVARGVLTGATSSQELQANCGQGDRDLFLMSVALLSQGFTGFGGERDELAMNFVAKLEICHLQKKGVLHYRPLVTVDEGAPTPVSSSNRLMYPGAKKTDAKTKEKFIFFFDLLPRAWCLIMKESQMLR